jgi:tRNA pseudouridine38-40 synthase
MTLFDDPLDDDAESIDLRSAPQQRIRMVVAYDGSRFHGFAAQPEITTVAGTLARSLERVMRLPPSSLDLTCAGRTDAGVHAWGQVVSFDVPAETATATDLSDVQQALNKLCGPAVVVREIGEVDPSFDARFSARGRLYRYTIVNRPWPDPFLAHVAWHVAAPLDLRAMTLACDPFIGEHDFSSFCRRPKPSSADAEPVSLTRRVTSARWEQADEGVLHFWIEANAFCHQMVRSITGTLVEVGRGKKRAGEMMGILRAKDRHAAGDLAPPEGLCLWEVRY